MANGSFSTRFAKRKTWKLNSGLQDALLECSENGDQIIDIGAGIGRYVAWLNQHARFAVGIDGTEGIEELSEGLIYEIDMTQMRAGRRANQITGKQCDLAICIEVMEHIPPELMDAFLDNLTSVDAKRFLISCGVLNQRGKDHVSCHEPYWVANHLGKRGLIIDEPETERLREIAGKGWSHKLLLFNNEAP